jgi:hypothetical protein
MSNANTETQTILITARVRSLMARARRQRRDTFELLRWESHPALVDVRERAWGNLGVRESVAAQRLERALELPHDYRETLRLVVRLAREQSRLARKAKRYARRLAQLEDAGLV